MTITTKHKGDACEMIVAGEMTLAGLPTAKMPFNWKGYDLVAQPHGEMPERISVKSRTFKKGGSSTLIYLDTDEFEWLAMVILPAGDFKERRIFIIPRSLADKTAGRASPNAKTAKERHWRIDKIAEKFVKYENNFKLEVK